MKKYSIEFSEVAIEDLQSISAYVGEYFIEKARTDAYVLSIIDRIELLKSVPNMGVLANDKLGVPVSTEIGYRLLFVDPYVAVYYVEDENKLITIVRIFHQKQDFSSLF
ncbi:type II toxin-antitoxin system RelE/ParE family toxin [Trichococcus sp. K1Tr]|uniref:type II toxin-antitoxin system RelE/ParE family toxin n=1 Tax=Trichococcus sp. K1Tr TaxID=3020847 RepID=UPI00232B7500|nr:type II toxin-antitoxin system RelE/ParE family toxin [Trichococcus sp. K1Tr]MDB6353909.1 type II toxin-antitoxin system RelE/ParE family toxin [Trichococcus sp. K1Tr]